MMTPGCGPVCAKGTSRHWVRCSTGITPTDIPGADESWFAADSRSPESLTLIAVVGPNRLTMRYAAAGDLVAARDLAAAFLDQLG